MILIFIIILFFYLITKYYLYKTFKEGIMRRKKRKKRKKSKKRKKRKKRKKSKKLKTKTTPEDRCIKYKDEKNYNISCENLKKFCAQKLINNCLTKGPDCFNKLRDKSCL